jgi:hypothetical protein
MQVHANYSQTLATLGAGRDEAQEMATRRAAEVRRRLAAATDKLLREEEEDVAFVKASASIDPGPDPQGDAYSSADGEQQQPEADVAPEREHGSHFSARA